MKCWGKARSTDTFRECTLGFLKFCGNGEIGLARVRITENSVGRDGRKNRSREAVLECCRAHAIVKNCEGIGIRGIVLLVLFHRVGERIGIVVDSIIGWQGIIVRVGDPPFPLGVPQ